MLNFNKKNYISLLVLFTLSLNSFAETGLSKKSAPNLAELYTVKTHATEHIRGIEKKLSATDEVDQEELLVEFAQSLLYYQVRHNKGKNEKYITSKGVSSLTANRLNDKVSKNPYSTHNIYRTALNAYKKASKLSLNKNKIKYTRKLSELTVKIQNKDELIQVFDELLQHSGDEKGTYLAHIDYADGLAKFKDNAAEIQFLFAISLRNSVDGVEANYRYANYLLENDKPREALDVLEKFTFEERNMYAHIALLRQKIMHQLKMNTPEVDSEVKTLRKRLSDIPFIRSMSKFTVNENKSPQNILDISTAHAYAFAHNNEGDDSRGKYANNWVYGRFVFTASLINAAEVVYNNARGEQRLGRIAIAWAIRNRATIDMNGCDFYPGAEGHSNVEACRTGTPTGPHPLYTEVAKRYSCVVHGGTITAGASHSQMNDTHVNLNELETSGIIWEMLHVINGRIPDPTGPN